MDKLYVVTAISNPVRYKARYALYHRFAKQMLASGVHFYTVEMAFGNRPFEVTSADNPCHLQVRSDQELWHKENLLNLIIEKLPPEAKYVAWVDADVMFTRPDWAEETVEQLQHFKVVQMFSHAQDLGPNFEPLQLHAGFVYNYLNFGTQDQSICPDEQQSNVNGHPGYCWAARRETLEQLGGLIDFAILGSADHNMAKAFLGLVDKTFFPGITQGYKDRLRAWQALATKHVLQDIGYVPGTINHYWHGKKKNRGYDTRWKILSYSKFDPNTDLFKDDQGLICIPETNLWLRDSIRKYFRSRNEDSVDV